MDRIDLEFEVNRAVAAINVLQILSRGEQACCQGVAIHKADAVVWCALADGVLQCPGVNRMHCQLEVHSAVATKFII